MKIKYDVIIPQLRTPAPTLMNYSALGEEGWAWILQKDIFFNTHNM